MKLFSMGSGTTPVRGCELCLQPMRFLGEHANAGCSGATIAPLSARKPLLLDSRRPRELPGHAM
ncbi:hypothetical protein ACVWYH_005003 [Bradyrhizobium sp. GM24.11]